jgi:hypothetical protein
MITAEYYSPAFLLPPPLPSPPSLPRIFTTSLPVFIQGQGNRMQDIPPTTYGVTSILLFFIIQ